MQCVPSSSATGGDASYQKCHWEALQQHHLHPQQLGNYRMMSQPSSTIIPAANVSTAVNAAHPNGTASANVIQDFLVDGSGGYLMPAGSVIGSGAGHSGAFSSSSSSTLTPFRLPSQSSMTNGPGGTSGIGGGIANGLSPSFDPSAPPLHWRGAIANSNATGGNGVEHNGSGSSTGLPGTIRTPGGGRSGKGIGNNDGANQLWQPSSNGVPPPPPSGNSSMRRGNSQQQQQQQFSPSAGANLLSGLTSGPSARHAPPHYSSSHYGGGNFAVFGAGSQKAVDPNHSIGQGVASPGCGESNGNLAFFQRELKAAGSNNGGSGGNSNINPNSSLPLGQASSHQQNSGVFHYRGQPASGPAGLVSSGALCPPPPAPNNTGISYLTSDVSCHGPSFSLHPQPFYKQRQAGILESSGTQNTKLDPRLSAAAVVASRVEGANGEQSLDCIEALIQELMVDGGSDGTTSAATVIADYANNNNVSPNDIMNDFANLLGGIELPQGAQPSVEQSAPVTATPPRYGLAACGPLPPAPSSANAQGNYNYPGTSSTMPSLPSQAVGGADATGIAAAGLVTLAAVQAAVAVTNSGNGGASNNSTVFASLASLLNTAANAAGTIPLASQIPPVPSLDVPQAAQELRLTDQSGLLRINNAAGEPHISLSDLYCLLGPECCSALAPQLAQLLQNSSLASALDAQPTAPPLHPFEQLKLPKATDSNNSPTGSTLNNLSSDPATDAARDGANRGPVGSLSPPPPPLGTSTLAGDSWSPQGSGSPAESSNHFRTLDATYGNGAAAGAAGNSSDYSRNGFAARHTSQGGNSSTGGASSRKGASGNGASGLLSRLHLLSATNGHDDSDDLFDLGDDDDASDSAPTADSTEGNNISHADAISTGLKSGGIGTNNDGQGCSAGGEYGALFCCNGLSNGGADGVQLSQVQAAGISITEASIIAGAKNSTGGSPHSVCPSSLACRKRLTMTASRGCRQIREIIGALRYHVARGDWDSALSATLYFCCCADKLIPKPEGAIASEHNDHEKCGTTAGYCTNNCGCVAKKQEYTKNSGDEHQSDTADVPVATRNHDEKQAGITSPVKKKDSVSNLTNRTTGSIGVESTSTLRSDGTVSDYREKSSRTIATEGRNIHASSPSVATHTGGAESKAVATQTDRSIQTSLQPSKRQTSRDWTAKLSSQGIKKNPISGVCCECKEEIYYPSIWTSLRVSPADLMNYDDFAMLCASLFRRVSVHQPGQPPVIYPQQFCTGHPVETLSKGAKEIRQVICDIQTLLLMCMASKVDLQPCEQLRLKNLAASTLYSLVWHPHILEALAPVFFQLSGQSPNDCFCSFLIHWGGTGVLQLIFEIFLLVLVKRARWRAALWLLSCTSIGENLLLPAICLIDVENQEPFLPEAANIIRCRCEILARLRFPAGAVTDTILDLSTYLAGDRSFHDQPWPFKAPPNELVLSLLPLVLGKTFSDDLLVYRGWHDRARGDCPVKSYAPSDVYEYLRVQILNPEGERRLLSEDDLHIDRALDEAIPAYVFLGDPELKEEYLSMLPKAGEGRMMDDRVQNNLRSWKPSDPSILTPPELLELPNYSHSKEADHEELICDSYLYSDKMVSLFRRLPDHPEAMERCLSVVELAARICEIYFVQSKSQYSSAFDEVTENNTRESLLQMSKRTVGELTGCTLGRVDLCYLRLLESYETIYGVPSQLSGLVGPRKHFLPCLNMSLLMHQLTLEPLVESGIRRFPKITPACPPTCLLGSSSAPGTSIGAKPGTMCNSTVCNNWKADHATATRTDNTKDRLTNAASVAAIVPTATTNSGGTISIARDVFSFQTFLPAHVAQLLPAWLSTRTHAQPHTESQRWGLDGWQILAREIMVAASRTLPRFPTHPKVAPHLNGKLLLMFLLLYTEAGNPRAVHLLTRFACAAKHPECREHVLEFLVQVLERAKRSKFILVADAIAQITLFASSEPLAPTLAKLVMEVYIEAGDGVRAMRHLESIKCNECQELLEPYREQAMQLQAVSQNGDGKNGKTAQKQFTKESRLRGFLAVVKNLQANNDVEGAVRYFYELRDSPGGILDISVANKILHLCVTYGRLNWAEQILQVLRSDAHCEINGIDFIPGACVRPDVVTCNIIIKGLARCKPPRIDDIDHAIQHMEQPFHLGGDGVKVDQVTIHTAINAAVQCGRLEKAWEYLRMLKKRQIKIDGFTCSTLVRQLGSHSNPELLEDVAELVESLEFEDPVLMSSMIEIYNKQGEPGRMKKMLDKYQQRVSEPTPYAVAVMIKGYGACGRFSKAVNLWKKLEERSDVRWSPCILGCVMEAFLANGHLHYALKASELARSVNTVLEASQLSSLIRLCLSHQRFGEALKLYKYMREHDMNPCDVTYNNLMHTCVQAGDLETAMDILNDMVENSSNVPDIITYSTIIKGLCDRGAMDNAIDLFRSLPARNLKPDIVTYNTILEGYAKTGDQQKVESMFQELVSNGVKPTCFTLTILVKFYGRKCMIDTVLELVKTLPKVYKFKMDTFVYTASIAACAWNGRLKEAIKLLEEMRDIFGASARTYGTLIAGSVRNQQWWYLSKVLQSASEDKVQLERRDVHVLRDVLQLWTNGRISDPWLASGFNQAAAEQLRTFIATQKKRK